ncbi:hypothetical protein Hanom_Chr02g00097251 [Helianthus anomalus]
MCQKCTFDWNIIRRLNITIRKENKNVFSFSFLNSTYGYIKASRRVFKGKVPFSTPRLGQFCNFRPKVCFSAPGSKRFKVVSFSSGSLTPSTFIVKSGVFSSFLST